MSENQVVFIDCRELTAKQTFQWAVRIAAGAAKAARDGDERVSEGMTVLSRELRTLAGIKNNQEKSARAVLN